MNRPRAADDFETIRARLDELRRERAASEQTSEKATAGPTDRADSEVEQRRRARIAGLPPPWAPTIFIGMR